MGHAYCNLYYWDHAIQRHKDIIYLSISTDCQQWIITCFQIIFCFICRKINDCYGHFKILFKFQSLYYIPTINVPKYIFSLKKSLSMVTGVALTFDIYVLVARRYSLVYPSADTTSALTSLHLSVIKHHNNNQWYFPVTSLFKIISKITTN